jgi:hypothetical protein
MVMLWLRLCDDSCVNRGEADASSLANGWRRLFLPAISVPGSAAVELGSPLAHPTAGAHVAP